MLIILGCFNSNSQISKKEVKGNKEYDKLAFADAIKTYEKMYKDGSKSSDMLYKLGNAYYFNAELEKANKWYSELYTTNAKLEAEFYYRFAQTLKAVKDYTTSDVVMGKFSQQSGTDNRAKLFLKNRDYLDKIKRNSGRYKIENAGINSKYSDYGTAFNGKEVVFSSARDTGNFYKRIHTWTGQYFTNLYSSPILEDYTLGAVAKFGKKLNTKFHEDTPAFTKDGKTVYFTRNDYLEQRGYSAEKVTLLKIFKATVDQDGQWNNITPLSFTSDNYQAAHPALSADEKTLFFASDMPGTRGQSDLYKVKINDDGGFGKVENLGDAINTEGRETYPFISDDNELYFASDGQPGLGGLDIYVTKIPKDGSNNFKEVLNLGEEANSSKDDFALIIDSKTKIGFLSSNRDGGQGNDDIYKFAEIKPIWCEQVLIGLISDEATQATLPNTTVQLLDESFNKINETVSDAQGKYQFLTIECGKKYYLRASIEGYIIKEVAVSIATETGKTILNIDLKKVEIKKETLTVKVGDDLAKTLNISMIYFDLSKSLIRPDAAVELTKTLNVMLQSPTMTIDIRSHTDSRDTANRNTDLSKRRNKSTIAWLVKNGIAAKRITGRGYGESRLINRCKDGVKCSEAEHQRNRRSEFIVTAL